jgi:peptidoglycan hydrolase CwlO-like protein
MKKSLESLVTDFQNACLQKLAEVEKIATAEIASLQHELSHRDGRLREVSGLFNKRHAELEEAERTIRDLHEVGTALQSDCVLLSAKLSERDARIEGLLKIVNAPENDAEPDQSEAISRLAEELRETQSALEDAQSEISTLEEETKDLQKQVDELPEFPEAETCAAIVHDFLRAERLLPANLDVPLCVAHHAYRDGLARAVGWEFPS